MVPLWISVALLITNVLSFIPPLKEIHAIFIHKTTFHVGLLQAMITFLTCISWIIYELISLKETVVVILKASYGIIELVAIVFIIRYGPLEAQGRNITRVIQSTLSFAALTVVLAALTGFNPAAIGIMAALANCCQIYWKIEFIRKVIEENNVDLPLHYSWKDTIFFAVNAIIWSLYALWTLDYYLLVPNILLSAVGLVELIIVRIYHSSSGELQNLV